VRKVFWPPRNFNICVKFSYCPVLAAEPKEAVIRRRKQLGTDNILNLPLLLSRPENLEKS
jgi:hypothetical protein